MRTRLRDIDPHGKFAPHLKLAALAQAVPEETVRGVLSEQGVHTVRERKLSLEAVAWLAIAMNLYGDLPIDQVLERMSQGLRFLWPDEAGRGELLANKSAVCQRRYQLRARPMAALFRRVCQPMATPQTPGAFWSGLRLMGIDGHTEDVPDTADNARCFGRHGTDRGPSAFPQVLVVTLCELGTHALVDAAFLPALAGEHRGAHRVLRSITPGMLVMWDRGLHEFALIAEVRERGGHVLARLPNNIRPRQVRRLPDGSWLGDLLHPDPKRRRRGEHLRVRMIEYTFTDPQASGHGQRYRVVTTLLDPDRYPARALAGLYHERWEIELSFDEVDTHQLEQHLMTSPLRSRKPVGVIQELYGLLLAHYAVRFLMHEAALQAEVDPDRISFTHALRIIQDAVWQFQIIDEQLLPGLYRRLLSELSRELLPERSPRAEPRAVKRKMVRYPLKRLEHQHWPQPTRPYWRSLTLI